MQQNFYSFNHVSKLLLTTLLVIVQLYSFAQTKIADSTKVIRKISPYTGQNIGDQYDFGDLTRNILHPGRKPDSFKQSSGITIVPNLSANPTVGFQVGIKAVATKRLGDDLKTFLSVGATSASITTKNVIYFYLNHNIFTPGNKLNLQGNIVAAKTVSPDYGLGIGRSFQGGSASDKILADPTHQVYGLNSFYFNVREKVYKNVAKNFFLGAGFSVDVRRNIEGKDTSTATPSAIYNIRHGFPQDHYAAAGLLFNAEYTTRDNPNRAYKGIFADAGVRINQTWIGSTKNSVQLTTDFRKYFSLSTRNPEEVLAIWNWGSYLLSGNIPYLELPGTSRDGAFRSGRGYTNQYFKGTKFNDTEVEYRLPITKNKFLSGVAFGNLQTANDEQGTKLFQVFQPGYGAGLRVLFSKTTRTNLALDYAFGKFGSKGFFLNLNEAF